MLQDIIVGLRSQEFHKVILIIRHGGVLIAGPAIRELNAIFEDLQVIKVDSANAPHCAEILEGDPKNDIHAGEKGRLLFQQIVEDYVAAIEDAFRYGEGGAW